MALLLGISSSSCCFQSRLVVTVRRENDQAASLKSCCLGYGHGTGTGNKPRARGIVRTFFLNPTEQPILKEAIKEPVAFLGGMFAGVLRLDLNEDPLKEWVSRAVEASGVTEEEIAGEASKVDEEAPQEIEIE